MIEVDLQKQYAILYLNRPEKRNALSLELIHTLRRELHRLAHSRQQETRVVILAARGPTYCAGIDLNELAESKQAKELMREMALLLADIAYQPQVTIAAVQGRVFAGGVALLAASDLCIASSDCTICLPEVQKGVVPAFVYTLLRDQIAGRVLKQMILTAEPIDAKQAYDWSLVHKIAEGDPLEEALAMAKKISTGAPRALGHSKALFHRHSPHLSLRDRLQRAVVEHYNPLQEEERKEGIRAFFEKRPPRWRLDIETDADF